MRIKTIWLVMGFVVAGCLLFFSKNTQGETVNPASAVTADSDNTANTIVYRDSSGNFSATGITCTTLTAGTLNCTNASYTNIAASGNVVQAVGVGVLVT